MNEVIYKYPYTIYLENISYNYLYDDNIYISDYYYKKKTHTLNQALNNITLESYIQYAKGIMTCDLLNNLNTCLTLNLINIINTYSIYLISNRFRDDIFKLCDKIIIYKKNIKICEKNIFLDDIYFSELVKHKYKYIICLKDIIISLYKNNICNNSLTDIKFYTYPNILIYKDDIFYINKQLKKLKVYDFTYST